MIEKSESAKGGKVHQPLDKEVPKISKVEKKAALKRKKNGETVGPDDTLMEAWKGSGEKRAEYLT